MWSDHHAGSACAKPFEGTLAVVKFTRALQNWEGQAGPGRRLTTGLRTTANDAKLRTGSNRCGMFPLAAAIARKAARKRK
jgi:hypothetical protein